MNAAFPLAVCAELVFTDLPMPERAIRLAELGFAVEIWDWSRHDVAALARSGAQFSSMTGYLRGALADDAGADELLTTAAQSIPVALELGCPRLNLHGTGLDAKGLPVVPSAGADGPMWLKARDTLDRLADLGERAGVTFMLENLNTAVDHPGVPFARAEDCLALVASVGRPGIKLNLDLYHAQIGEGNLIELCRQALPHIAEIQVADVPGRHEPGTGEIAYPRVARALHAMGYRGTIGLEALPEGDHLLALQRFRDAFTL
ncbi:MAG: TIM barrel protein [Aurantimonas endophytica]|uniref:Hydroxypyruvate isomerase n=1 Tax=Aurantimonas endophytica TaxID=1522175 RepID=A0A7W6HG11_9HYPH|nr:TIM barrel protein [Aurantimonas endophytica]MBB4004551.1 hydroxypyruvate isomerase [Aurantimonas endophytica]MCO6405387.1 TIM barrel protein [Aurantimonas endophytica]